MNAGEAPKVEESPDPALSSPDPAKLEEQPGFLEFEAEEEDK